MLVSLSRSGCHFFFFFFKCLLSSARAFWVMKKVASGFSSRCEEKEKNWQQIRIFLTMVNTAGSIIIIPRVTYIKMKTRKKQQNERRELRFARQQSQFSFLRSITCATTIFHFPSIAFLLRIHLFFSPLSSPSPSRTLPRSL